MTTTHTPYWRPLPTVSREFRDESKRGIGGALYCTHSKEEYRAAYLGILDRILWPSIHGGNIIHGEKRNIHKEGRISHEG